MLFKQMLSAVVFQFLKRPWIYLCSLTALAAQWPQSVDFHCEEIGIVMHPACLLDAADQVDRILQLIRILETCQKLTKAKYKQYSNYVAISKNMVRIWGFKFSVASFENIILKSNVPSWCCQKRSKETPPLPSSLSQFRLTIDSMKSCYGSEIRTRMRMRMMQMMMPPVIFTGPFPKSETSTRCTWGCKLLVPAWNIEKKQSSTRLVGFVILPMSWSTCLGHTQIRGWESSSLCCHRHTHKASQT